MNKLIVIYVIVTLVYNIGLAVAFRKNTAIDLMLKITCTVLSIFGGYLVYTGKLLG